MRLAALPDSRLDERFKRLRELIATEVSNADEALLLLREYHALVERTADAIADAWAEGNRIGQQRGFTEGYTTGYRHGQED